MMKIGTNTRQTLLGTLSFQSSYKDTFNSQNLISSMNGLNEVNVHKEALKDD